MNVKSMIPTPVQPINRLHTGQGSTLLTELLENGGADAAVLASEFGLRSEALASYDGDDE